MILLKNERKIIDFNTMFIKISLNNYHGKQMYLTLESKLEKEKYCKEFQEFKKRRKNIRFD